MYITYYTYMYTCNTYYTYYKYYKSFFFVRDCTVSASEYSLFMRRYLSLQNELMK